VASYRKPLGVLVEHRIDHVGECLLAEKETMPAGEQIAFEPSLAHVFAEHFHGASVRRDVIVGACTHGVSRSRDCGRRPEWIESR
jgi:hypothetical protein